MPLQTFNFPTQQGTDFGLGEIFQNYYKGKEMAQMPQRREQERLDQALQRELLQKQLEYYGPTKESEIAKNLREAQTGGLSGTAKNIALLHQMQENPEHDRGLAQKLQQQIDFERNTQEILNKQHEIYTDTVQYRTATPNQKLMMEMDALSSGQTYDLQGKLKKISPQQSLQRVNVLSKAVLNNITDQPTRQKLENGSNFAVTLENINPEKAFRLSGGLGAMAQAWEKTKGKLGGKQSEEYVQFQEELQKLKIGADQLAQFYSLASAERIREDVDYLVNPQNWFTHPDTAKAKYKSLVDIFTKEHSNLMQMVASPGMYGFNFQPTGQNQLGGQLSAQLQNTQPQAQSQSATPGKVHDPFGIL